MADEQIIYLSPDEELTNVRERLEQVSSRHIILVIPQQAQLRSLVGWRLLHSRARELNKEILIISSDRQIRSTVKAAGFKVADTLESMPSHSNSRAKGRSSRIIEHSQPLQHLPASTNKEAVNEVRPGHTILTSTYSQKNTGVNFLNLRNTGVDFPQVTIPENTSTFRIRILEEPLTTYNLTSTLSAITDLSTKCWLIAHARLADLIEYTQTHDVQFVEETQLHITKLTHNSPLVGSFKLDLSASNVAEAIVTAIDGATQAKARLEKAKLENEAKAQEIEQNKQKAEQTSKEGILELERKELANERERLEILEKRLDVQKKGIEYALEIASKTIEVLHPNADQQTKAMLIQALLPTMLQLQSSKGLELVLPPPQNPTIEHK